MEREIGTVKWFDTKKGFGFIINDAGEDCLVHYSQLCQQGFKNLREKQEVSFVQVESDVGLQAHEVMLLETA